MATLISTPFTSGWDSAAWTTSGTGTFGGSGSGTITVTPGQEAHAWSKMASTADAGVLFRMKNNAVGHARVALRSSGTESGNNGEGTNGIIFEWANDTTLSWYYNSASNVGGDTTIPNTTVPNSNGVFYWHRIEIQGSTYRYRTWADGAGEPGTWLINQTFTNGGITTGVFTVSAGNYGGSSATFELDDFSAYDFTSNTVTGAATLSAASNATVAAVVSKLGASSQSAASNLTASAVRTALAASSQSAASALTADGSITQRDWVNVGFDSASDLNGFTQSGFSVSGSAANANVAVNGDLDVMTSSTFDLTNGSFVTEINATESSSGVYGLIGLQAGQYQVGFFLDGWGILAKTRNNSQDVDSTYIGQYLNAQTSWLRIDLTNGVPVLSYSGDGSTWTQVSGTFTGLPTGAWTNATTFHQIGAYASTNFNLAVRSVRAYGPLPAAVVDGGSLALSGASGIVVAGLVERLGSTALSASGGLAADSLVETFGAAALSGEGFLTATSKEPAVLLGDTQLDGTFDLDASAWLEVLGEAELDLRLYSGIEVSAQVYPIRWRLTTPSRRVPHKGLGRFTPHIQGLSLVKDDGFWKTVETVEDFAAYQAVYLGGYKHWISKAEYDELVKAGYGQYVEVVLPQVPADPTTTGFGSGSFGSGPFGVGTGSQAYGAGSYSANSYQEGT